MREIHLKHISFFSALFIFVALEGESHAKKVSQSIGGDAVGAIESRYYSLADLSADFTQVTKVALVDRTITKKGTFLFKKGGKLKIEYAGKDGKNYISDGTTLWIFTPGDEAGLQTFAVSDETVPKEALSFMSGFGKLRKEFSVSPSAAFESVPADFTSLRLVPRSKARHYESLDALFDRDHLLKELIVHNTSGNTSHYKFDNIKINTGLNDSLFIFSMGKK